MTNPTESPNAASSALPAAPALHPALDSAAATNGALPVAAAAQPRPVLAPSAQANAPAPPRPVPSPAAAKGAPPPPAAQRAQGPLPPQPLGRPAAPSAAPSQAFLAGPIDVPSVGSRRLFNRLTVASFVLFVLLPVIAAAYYFAYVAADRYAVEVKFAIRSPGGIATPDLLGMVTGATSAGSTQADSYMVVDFIESRQFLDAISARVDLDAIYATDKADFFTRMPAHATKEEQVDYLPRMLSVYYDSTSQIITVEAQAFTPEDALAMTESVIEATSQLINKVSERARQDTVRLAEDELARAEAALKAQRTAIAVFRETEQKIDPTATVAAQENVLAQLQGELSRTLTEMSSLREFLAEDAPSVRVLRSQIDSIQRQIIAERARVGSGGFGTAGESGTSGESLNLVVSQYEELIVDLEFRQRAYLSALASLEAARVEAVRQQRYVAAFVLPSFPEEAIYPKVKTSLSLIAVIAFLIWGVLSMFVQIVREHLN